MAKIQYIAKNFRAKSLDLIDKSNTIIEDFHDQGYDLTVRMLYYQMVANDFIPNTERSYKNFVNLISNARMAGLVDWNRIVDRTRITKGLPHWNHPREVIYSAWYSYNIDQWEGQYYRPRVWIEKDALVGIIGRTCNQWDVPFLACRGYMSQSAMWNDAQLAAEQEREGCQPVIIHLGDHDPSGIDMTRDITDRMDIFGVMYVVNRIALNYDQIEERNPPPNPTKLSDSRAADYVSEYGYHSWELDALPPDYINTLLDGVIQDYIEKKDQWDLIQARLAHHKTVLKSMDNNYDNVETFLKDGGMI